MIRFGGILIVILALGIAIIPQFTNCQYAGRSLTLANGNTVPMKCLWTARAELAAGVSLIAVGAMLTGNRRRENLRSLSIVGIILSVFVALMPISLIGVCQSSMVCNTFMRPSMIISGSLTFLVCLIGIIWGSRHKDKDI